MGSNTNKIIGLGIFILVIVLLIMLGIYNNIQNNANAISTLQADMAIVFAILTPTQTDTPSPTPIPTETLDITVEPSDTPIPTETPTPTPSQTPTVTPLPAPPEGAYCLGELVAEVGFYRFGRVNEDERLLTLSQNEVAYAIARDGNDPARWIRIRARDINGWIPRDLFRVNDVADCLTTLSVENSTPD